MPIFDHLCQSCGTITEAIMPVDKEATDCRKCGKKAVRIISCTGQNCLNDDAPWIRSAAFVADHDSDKPETREFVRNPTRSNMRRWMKAEGLRHIDPGEKRVRHEPDTEKIHREVMEKVMARRRIEI